MNHFGKTKNILYLSLALFQDHCSVSVLNVSGLSVHSSCLLNVFHRMSQWLFIKPTWKKLQPVRQLKKKLTWLKEKATPLKEKMAWLKFKMTLLKKETEWPVQLWKNQVK